MRSLLDIMFQRRVRDHGSIDEIPAPICARTRRASAALSKDEIRVQRLLGLPRPPRLTIFDEEGDVLISAADRDALTGERRDGD